MNHVERYAAKIAAMCDFATSLSALATDPRIKVGAVVFPVDCSSVVGIGYNGVAAGQPHDVLRPGREAGDGESDAVHAETNALMKAGRLTGPCVMAVTVSPCHKCAAMILNAGWIVGVVYDQEFSSTRGLRVLQDAGVTTLRFSNVKTRGERTQHAVDVLSWWRDLRPERPLMT